MSFIKVARPRAKARPILTRGKLTKAWAKLDRPRAKLDRARAKLNRPRAKMTWWWMDKVTRRSREATCRQRLHFNITKLCTQ